MEQTIRLVSPSSGEECRAPHYLAELSVTRKNKGKSLPIKFWNLPEYKREYKLAIQSAHSILKIFSIEVILAALNSKEGNWIYSLRCNQLVELANKEKNRLAVEQKIIAAKPKIEYNESNVTHVPKTQAKPSSINQLRD